MLLSQIREEVSQKQLDQVELFADRLWGRLGVDVSFTRHFIERLNDSRNGKEISSAELIRLFKKEYEAYGDKISGITADGEAVMLDLLTSINLPFVMKTARDGSRELVAKTVMRKKDFKSSDQIYKVQ